MSQFPHKVRRRSGASSPLSQTETKFPRMYRKTLDRRFDFGTETPGVTLRLRIFTPIWENRHAPMVLLCWTSGSESECLNKIVSGLRREIVSLLRRVSLVERFVCLEDGKERTERIHKVLRIQSRDHRRVGESDPADERTTLLPIRRSVLEALIGEPLDGQERRIES